MLLGIQEITVSYGDAPVLANVSLQINEGERIGLVGRNGAGKSTLMRVIAGEITPERGNLAKKQDLAIAMLAQEVPSDLEGSVFDEVSRGLGPHADLLAEFHRTSALYATEHTEALRAKLVQVEAAFEKHGVWNMNLRVEQVLSRMELPADLRCEDLSAGMKRRVLLAKAIVRQPDILLLDEPTNHLDIAAISWLEEFLLKYDRTVVFVTHDRMFLRRLSTRILDVDRGNVTSWACDHATYLERKEAALEAEAKQRALFDKRLAQEEVWIRTGIKARRTRNEGRVRALEKLREIRQERRERPGEVRMQMAEAEKSGRMVAEVKNASFAYSSSSPPTIRDLTILIMRRDKIGIVGQNGAGKTTLLRLLLGELSPQTGSVRHGTKLEIAYFDQLHAQLDDEKSIIENVTDGADRIQIGGQSRHVIGYLEDFLFTPEQSRRAVKYLSGGERNRLLLARLFTKPSNVLVLDEPTNDLDLETLELLETLLADYQGTVLLVSHDRDFLNNVVTSTLVFEGDGMIKEYAGGFDDWQRQKSEVAALAEKAGKEEKAAEAPAKMAARTRRLSYKEQQELAELPNKIAELESQQQELHDKLADPNFYRQVGDRIAETKAQLAAVEEAVQKAYSRWESLESGSPA